MPADIMLGVPVSKEPPKGHAEYAKQLIERLGVAYAEVRKNLREAQVRQKSYYDAKSRIREFEVGDLVYPRKESVKPGLSRKLCPMYIGPFFVTKGMSPCLYRVEDRSRSWVLHHDKLKVCEDRVVPYGIRRKRHEVLRSVSGAQSSDLDATIATQTETVDSDESMQELGSADNDEASGMRSETVAAGSSVREDEAGSEVADNADLDETMPYGVDHAGDEELTNADPVVSAVVFPGLTVSEDGTGGASISNTDLDDTIPYSGGDHTGTMTESKMARDLFMGRDSRAECYWMVENEDWGLSQLFKEFPKTRSGCNVIKPSRFH